MLIIQTAGAILALATALAAFLSEQAGSEGLMTVGMGLPIGVLEGLLVLTVALCLTQAAQQGPVPARVPVRHRENPTDALLSHDDELWRT